MQVNVTYEKIDDCTITIKRMVEIIQKHYNDLQEFKDLSLRDFFFYVCSLEYRKDPQGMEQIARPKFTLLKDWPCRDCDDKTILMGSFCKLKKIPFSIYTCSYKANKRMGHVFGRAKVQNEKIKGKVSYTGLIWLDATYPDCRFNELRRPEKITALKQQTDFF